eukprot:9037733-Prorocentrum_lima.AAC.1
MASSNCSLHELALRMKMGTHLLWSLTFCVSFWVALHSDAEVDLASCWSSLVPGCQCCWPRA